jgi:hypothetical protein
MKQLDHLYGHKVKEIKREKSGWYVLFDNDVKVINTDQSKPFPQIDGDVSRLTFVTSIMEQDSTQMVLAVIDSIGGIIEEWRANLNPLDYQIYDPQTKETVTPQAGGYGAVKDAVARQKAQLGREAPPEPVERLQEGPSKQSEIKEEKTTTKKTKTKGKAKGKKNSG